jgi:Pyridoxamine 5'-phosphate oxidase
VSVRIPDAAREVLERGVLCHVAARARRGPHLTPVVYVFDGGRIWLTTSRGAAKAWLWGRDPSAAGLVRLGDRAILFRGTVRTYDAFDVGSWPGAVASGPAIIRAATRFTVKNARFFAGYAVDARRVPFAWTPPGRVFVAIEPTAGWLVSPADGSRLRRWGTWPRGASGLTSFRADRRLRMPDLGAPAGVRHAVARSADAALAFDAGDALTVLPAAARRVPGEGSYQAVIARSLYELTGVRGSAPAALTLDHASRWRAADMTGMLLRGTARAYVEAELERGAASLGAHMARVVGKDGGPPDPVLVRLRPDSVVWWEGWAGGTVGRPRSGDRARSVTRGG